MTTPRFLAVGSLTSDLFIKTGRQESFEKDGHQFVGFCLGDKLRIEEKHEAFGGGGANVAVGLARFGVPSAILGRFGDDFIAEKIRENLEKEGVQTNCIQTGAGEDSGFSVIISADCGERTVLFAPGANDHFLDFDREILKDYEGVCLQHLSSSSRAVFDKLRAFLVKHPEKFFSWNPGHETLEHGLWEYTDLVSRVNVLLVNLEEAQLFTKKDTLEEMFAEIYAAGCNGNVIITDGMRGATGCDGKFLYHSSVLEGKERIDTLGAGDSFLSGTVAATITGKSLPEAMKLATINAAFVVEQFGAQTGLQSESELVKLASKIEIETKPFSCR